MLKKKVTQTGKKYQTTKSKKSTAKTKKTPEKQMRTIQDAPKRGIIPPSKIQQAIDSFYNEKKKK